MFLLHLTMPNSRSLKLKIIHWSIEWNYSKMLSIFVFFSHPKPMPISRGLTLHVINSHRKLQGVPAQFLRENYRVSRKWSVGFFLIDFINCPPPQQAWAYKLCTVQHSELWDLYRVCMVSHGLCILLDSNPGWYLFPPMSGQWLE